MAGARYDERGGELFEEVVGKRSRGRQRLRWKDKVGRYMRTSVQGRERGTTERMEEIASSS